MPRAPARPAGGIRRREWRRPALSVRAGEGALTRFNLTAYFRERIGRSRTAASLANLKSSWENAWGTTLVRRSVP